MEKIKVNNQVVCMRKFIKQAKVHIINKLVKDVKGLKLKKGTDLQLEKNKRKSEKLLAEIEIIKKLPVDDLCKRTLMKEKDWESVLSDKSSTFEERSFALVANFNAVQDEVKKFHNSDPDLASILPDLLLQWEQKKKDPSEKHFKGMKASEFRKQKKEKLKGKKQNAKSLLPTNKKAELVKPEHSEDDIITSEKLDISSESIEEDAEGNAEDRLSKSDENSESLDKDNTPILPEKKQKKLKQVAVLDLSKFKEDESIPLGSAADSEGEESDKDSNKETVVRVKNDPFFGEVNEEAEESIRRLESMNSSSGRAPRGFGRGFRRGGNFGRNGPRKSFGDKRHESFRGGKNLRPGEQNRSLDRNRGRSVRGGNRFQPARNENPKFGDKQNYKSQDRNSFSKDFGNKQTSKAPSTKENTPKTISSGSIHPSWEAKRKQKMQCSILPSESKRIKFDD